MRALERGNGKPQAVKLVPILPLDGLFQALHQVMPFLQRHELDGVARRDCQGNVHPVVVYYQEDPLHELLRVADLDPEYRWFLVAGSVTNRTCWQILQALCGWEGNAPGF